MKITLCPNKSCHKGKVVTKEVYHCRFVLEDCSVCNGKGFIVHKLNIIKEIKRRVQCFLQRE